MDNYYPQYGEPSTSQEYPNTYNLWENSRYYDHFSAQNELYGYDTVTNGWATTWNKKPIDDAARDEKNRRIIKRDALFQDPSLFVSEVKNNLVNLPLSGQEKLTNGFTCSSQDFPAGYDWTQQNWKKAGEVSEITGVCSNHENKRTNKLHKKLLEVLSEPAKMSKAESMMQKMGWQGGALGKSGAGMTEPIAPNAIYASSTIGLGHQQEQSSNRTQKNEAENFKTNVLLHVLDFIRNDREVEIVFDRRMWKKERKQIHSIVNDVLSQEDRLIDFDSVYQMDIVQQICEENHYNLVSESEGVVPNRCLYLCKEAPKSMYLITPDDLKDETDESQPSEDMEEVEKKTDERKETIDEEEEPNPFLRSITRNLKNESSEEKMSNKFENDCKIMQNASKTEPYGYGKLVEYFVEFTTTDVSKELRFLGPFCDEDREIINRFTHNLRLCIDDPKKCYVFGENDEKFEDIMTVGRFEFNENSFGYCVITKRNSDSH